MQGTGGGIFIDEAYTIDKSIVTKEEQEKILLALQCLSPVDEMHTESILNRLSAVFQRNADWVKVDYSRWNTENDTSVFDTIKQAVLECKVLVMEYLDSYGKKNKTYRLSAASFIQIEGVVCRKLLYRKKRFQIVSSDKNSFYQENAENL